MGNPRAVLITASCTTSWFDWVHGELWLCPDGLLRRSVGVLKTVSHGSRTIDPGNRPKREFTPAEVAEILAAGGRNRWIPWTAMTSATLKRGVVDHSLHLEVGPGRREKFLWSKADGGFELLDGVLRSQLPGRYRRYDRLVG
jgi:hypothetical protein